MIWFLFVIMNGLHGYQYNYSHSTTVTKCSRMTSNYSVTMSSCIGAVPFFTMTSSSVNENLLCHCKSTLSSSPSANEALLWIDEGVKSFKANYKVFFFWVCWKQSNYFHSHIPPIKIELPYLKILIDLILNIFFIPFMLRFWTMWHDKILDLFVFS